MVRAPRVWCNRVLRLGLVVAASTAESLVASGVVQAAPRTAQPVASAVTQAAPRTAQPVASGVAQAAPRTAQPAASSGSGYFVTFVGLWCNAYTDIFANRARNDIVESLRDLGPNTQYGTSGALINPIYEKRPPQDGCHPITGWEFALGTGIRTRADTGVWGSISRVTGPYSTSIVTTASTPPARRARRPGCRRAPGGGDDD